MKKLLLIVSILCLSCKADDVINSNCNFLFDAGVNLNVNTNLPQFNQLQFNGNGVYVSNQGNSGIWLWRLSSSTLLAWDASDPSQPPSTCSTLTFSTGDVVESNCENANQYSLSTGFGLEGNISECTLKPYRVDNLGNGQFFISN
ncbi:hypothetical protein [uncultured Winogradskyella sp.]|uniref:hypothetical protein n=1 Tax=uncultured Winogradskyella sp. TaxID=395353 RepID=UPI002638CA03|nr:hypothetical protein [uncultured Winogradskyella sp.]